MTPPTDLELLQRTSRGDRDAFGRLVERHQSLVSSVAYSVVGDFSRSEDVAQEAFLAA
jgi:RNA polymerase sigma-70 factor (ECF subfamily)